MAGLTRQQIRTQVRADLDQIDSANSKLLDSELNEYIDQAVNYSAIQIEYPRDQIQVQVESNVRAYTLPSDAVLIRLAYFGDVNTKNDIVPLQIISEETLRELYPSWLDETTTNNNRPLYLIVLDRNTVAIHPKPNTVHGAAGKNLILEYIYSPASLSSDSSIPDLPVPFHSLLHFYAAHLAYVRLNNSDMSIKLFQVYQAKIKELKTAVTKETTEGLFFQFGYDLGLDNDGPSLTLNT